MTKDDKILWDLTTTLKNRCPLGIHGFYRKNYEKDLDTRDELLILDIKIVGPAAIPGIHESTQARPMLHESTQARPMLHESTQASSA